MSAEEIINQLQNLTVEDSKFDLADGHGFSTCYVYDKDMKKHQNLYDRSHPEVPDRISRIYDKCQEYELLKKCKRLPSRVATDEELLIMHSQNLIDTLRATQTMKSRDLSKYADSLDSIYLHPSSFECAKLAAGCTLAVIEEVASGKSLNGIGIVRPPGHHGFHDICSGFCLFNNVAIAAKKVQSYPNIDRILIVDWDVHHGNGTQSLFYKDPSVLYYSIHRYDHAEFYPFMEDANYDRAGEEAGEGFNINVAWNKFNPDLVIVSAGFDSARGDPKGLCNVTPEGFAHLTKLLMNLANGRLALILEGGYNLTSNAESMAACLRVLLGESCPPLEEAAIPCQSALESISNTLKTHSKYWKSLRLPAFTTDDTQKRESETEKMKPAEKRPTTSSDTQKRESETEKMKPVEKRPTTSSKKKNKARVQHKEATDEPT
ncbi:uncharacterized protein TRIADDRAFT_56890 [Trichoplax adhaerens]|uniref:Histone deacetylase domain-containing protein n=1 Tax=Trichoplax adhaerens TaxID=10228 RepID=B3RWV4_TRIAD|nr:hypothetical protein TRIADDRAFT_56890 [Trichoplax adhaerens]EDV24764.1 hypothetical protein TRIADDRAFT_56890 [Trichoplax adhaerens]|eukprot:XP_002112654.1 hypothetical protein TRIADDRAFT_56890 [Trichoplax adhaerens]